MIGAYVEKGEKDAIWIGRIRSGAGGDVVQE